MDDRSLLEKKVLVSRSHDPYLNLAIEEYLFDRLNDGQRILFLYTNSQSVIIGKHQNPWLETNLIALRETRTPLARRISGGGTVYHDMGNLNFSFMGPKIGFDRRANLSVIQESLRGLGIETELTKGHDIYAYGKKISGNSFCFRRNRALHHGTILLGADMGMLHRLLKSNGPLIETHAVKSRPAQTINLKTMHPELVGAEIKGAIISAYGFGDSRAYSENFVTSDLERAAGDLAERNLSWDWIYGRTPVFSCRIPFSYSIDARRIVPSSLALNVEKGRIAELIGPDDLGALLNGCKLAVSHIQDRMRGSWYPKHKTHMAAEAILKFAA